MMAIKDDAKPAYENPLIPNRRLRQIYLAMLQARALDGALPRTQRGLTAGLEACLASTSVDLRPDDLVSDSLAGGALDFLRGRTLGQVLRADARGRGAGLRVKADCGTAGRLPAAARAGERLWAALGAAAGLKVEAARSKNAASTVNGASESTTQAGVVVAYASPGELGPAAWRKVFEFAVAELLPVVFVLLPPQRDAAKEAAVSPLALKCGVPGIAVDAEDAVAIYRVAQESIGRARAGGGAALMECVPFVLEGAGDRRMRGADAIAGMEAYMLQRGVATRRWMEAEAGAFARRLGAAS